jgi:hypothetical protein
MTGSVNSRPKSCVAIISDHDDLHALAAQKALTEYDDVRCHVIECDRLSERGGLLWSNLHARNFKPRLPTTDGESVEVRAIDALWLRRCFVPQIVGNGITDPVHLDVINTSTPSALLGALLSSFTGRWISDPGATRAAENKLLQLRIARDAGLPVPRTLVSNDPSAIREFCSMLNYQVIVKAIRMSLQSPLLTRMVQPEHLASDECLRMCPAIYQEYIPGCQHLRVHIFGDYISAVLIESEDLDWRVNMAVPCRAYTLDASITSKLHQVLQTLQLRMGIVDLKLNGLVPTWLEINPQGQFLFAEGMAGLPLNAAISNFLYRESKAGANERGRP